MTNEFRTLEMSKRNHRFRIRLSGISYYIDPVSGSDSNTGLDANNAWQTWGKVTSEGVWAGNRILGKRGTTARETVTIGGDGATIGVYGDGGSTHVIRGADIVANASWSKTGGQTNVYEYAYAAPSGTDSTSMAWEDGTQLTNVADIATCDSTAGSYVLTGGNMYVHATDSSDVTANGKVYELPAREICLNFDDKSDCTVEAGLELTGAWSDDANYGNIRISGRNNQVKDLQSHDCRRHALQLIDSNTVACEQNIVDGGKFYGCVGNTISVFAVSGGTGTNNNTIKNTEITQEGEPDGREGLIILHSSSGRTNPVDGTKLINNHIHHQTDTTNSTAVILTVEVTNTEIRGNRFDNLRGTQAHIKLEDNVTGTRIIANRFTLGNNTGYFIMNEGATNTNDDNWVCNNGFIATGVETVKCVAYLNSATNGKVWNNYFTGVNDDVIRVADVGSQSGFSSNYNLFHNIQDASPFRWATTDYNLANWQSNTSQDANSATTDPDIDADGLMSTHILGGVYWTGAPPKDTNGASYSATTPSIGPEQLI